MHRTQAVRERRVPVTSPKTISHSQILPAKSQNCFGAPWAFQGADPGSQREGLTAASSSAGRSSFPSPGMPKPSQGTNAPNPSRLQPRAAGRGEQPLCSWGFSISSGDSAELGPRKSRSPPLQAGITFQQSRARFHRALVCNKTPAAARARCPGNSAQAAHCGPSLGTIRSFSLFFTGT